ncbi:MAG: DUF4292 domain-containing protein [Muribaculaceae bacterium]|nr:DUF4292 domain-containing protein [Muribaculaceae bacterium]
MKYSLLITLAALALIVAGCRAKQQVITTDYPKTDTTTVTPSVNPLETRLNTFAASQMGWTTLQTGGNVKVGGAKSFSSSMQMRMIRGKAIYISLRPLIGIEVGKIVITNDSVLVVDKYHKRYLAEPISLITNGVPVTVNEMQDIFLGRAFILGKGTVNTSTRHLVQLAADGTNYRLSPKSQPQAFNYGFTIDPSNHVIAVNVTPTTGTKIPYTARYSDVRFTLAGAVAHHADVAATVGNSKFTLALDLKDITWNTQVNIDDSKPTGYQRMNGHQITSILGDN